MQEKVRIRYCFLMLVHIPAKYQLLIFVSGNYELMKVTSYFLLLFSTFYIPLFTDYFILSTGSSCHVTDGSQYKSFTTVLALITIRRQVLCCSKAMMVIAA